MTRNLRNQDAEEPSPESSCQIRRQFNNPNDFGTDIINESIPPSWKFSLCGSSNVRIRLTLSLPYKTKWTFHVVPECFLCQVKTIIS